MKPPLPIYPSFRTGWTAVITIFVATLMVVVATGSTSADVVGEAEVLDGDTLLVDGQRIRLSGVDAPELGQVCRRDGHDWDCGGGASEILDSIVGDLPVRCETDGRQIGGVMLGNCFVSCFVGEQHVNALMAANGMALADPAQGDKYNSDERSAKAYGLGIWSSRFVTPWDWRRGDRLRTSPEVARD